MPRPATGSIKWRRDKDTGVLHWHVRLTLKDGSRPWVPLDQSIPRDDERRARECALETSDYARANGMIPEMTRETVTQYADRWCKWREGRGLGCVKDDRTSLARHVLPEIGHLEIEHVTRDDLKRFVVALDAKVKRGEHVDSAGNRRPFGWKTAANAWSVARALFRDAQRAKDVALCVRDDNPVDGLAGPDMGAKKAKVYLWPSEFAALVACERLPVRWRRLFALAAYTFARAGELAALDWSDVDLEHGALHIHRSLDTRRGRGLKATKSDAARRIPIEPALVPLLAAMHAEARGKGRVIPKLPGDGLSRKLLPPCAAPASRAPISSSRTRRARRSRSTI